MPYVVVDNFSGGLDSRRHVLNSKSGTLSKLVNAHITRGGEIEKRKRFFETIDMGVGEYFAAVTFGMEATAEGIYVFGRDPAPTSWLGGYAYGFNDTKFIYQHLAHPVFPDDFKLIGITHSTVYGGKPFVIAEFGSLDVAGNYGAAAHRIAFYDGVAIKDWYEGYTGKMLYSSSYTHFISNFVSYFPVSGYSASTPVDPLELYFTVTGQPGKPFTLTASTDFGGTPAITTTQAAKVAVPETLAKGSFSITGGSTTAANASRGGRYLDAASLPGIRSIRVGASSATAANGIDLIGWGAATGLKYNTYTVTESYGSDAGALYWNIRKAINDNTSSGLAHGHSARWASYGGWSGPDPSAVWIDAPSALGSGANGLLVQIEFDSNPHGVANLSEFIDTTTIAVSPYDNQRHIATFGVLANGSFNRVNSVKVDGVEVLGSSVSWESSHGETANAIAAQINAYTSSTEYVASVSDGSKVVLTGVAGSGKTPNGRVISVEAEGNIIISGITSFSGGVDTVAAVPQITKVDLEPCAEATSYAVSTEKKFSVTIVDPENPAVPVIVGASRVAGTNPNFSVTYKSKEYIGVGSTLYFSAVNDATKWDIYDTGSGFIDMSNNFGGREDLTGVGLYQNYLAVFSRRSIQLWSMDADPAQNRQVQVLANTGSIAPDSVVSVGSIDLLYLADNGVRSVRARENTDTAYASDVGSAIDSIVIDHIASLASEGYEDLVDKSKAVIEPIDGRYWLSIKDKIFVLSYFPGSNIAAWSIYEPGFTVDEMVAREDKVFLRSGDKIYVYGAAGFDNSVYDDCEVVVELPYLDANKPATYKEVKGMDATVEGEWEISIGFDHTNPTARDPVMRPTGPTFALGKIPATGIGTHFGLRMTNDAAGYARLANIIVHYDEMHSKHDAG